MANPQPNNTHEKRTKRWTRVTGLGGILMLTLAGLAGFAVAGIGGTLTGSADAAVDDVARVGGNADAGADLGLDGIDGSVDAGVAAGLTPDLPSLPNVDVAGDVVGSTPVGSLDATLDGTVDSVPMPGLSAATDASLSTDLHKTCANADLDAVTDHLSAAGQADLCADLDAKSVRVGTGVDADAHDVKVDADASANVMGKVAAGFSPVIGLLASLM